MATLSEVTSPTLAGAQQHPHCLAPIYVTLAAKLLLRGAGDTVWDLGGLMSLCQEVAPDIHPFLTRPDPIRPCSTPSALPCDNI